MRNSRNGGQQRLGESDWLLIAICAALVIASIAIVVRYFDSAFPQAAIDFRVDRNSSADLARDLLRRQKLDVRGMKHAARFDSDDTARIFLERSLGLEQANRVTSGDVHIWSWHHRWFRPLVEEELSVDVAPSGQIIGFTHTIPEERAIPDAGAIVPSDFLASIGVNVTDLRLIEQSERHLPSRVQRIYTWESRWVKPAGAQYRHTVTVDGNVVTSYSQRLKVPDAWVRSYHELRSKNSAAGSVDMILLAATMIGAVVVFIVRLRRGDLSLRFLMGVGIASIILVGGVALNSMPSQLAYYDTTSSYPAFLGQLALGGVVQSVGTAILLIVICGAGEVLYRQRLPQHLAIPRIWTPRSLASKRVFLSLILGYSLVPLFIAYQVVFYLGANHFGAWAPAEVPYDEILNSAFPFIAVMFAGFFPAFSEEFLSRAFSIPFIQRFVRWRFVAIVLAAFIWGFGHATYPNQPFWIRGVEVGIAGIAAGLLMDRFGLLPLLIWHYTIDAVYTATLLFASGNTYYIVSAAVASLLFAVPLIVSIVLYVRNRGFVPDDDLTNATLPVSPPPEARQRRTMTPLPPAIRATRTRLLVCAALVIAAAITIALRPDSPQDAIDYRIDSERAKEIARDHLGRVDHAYVIATPVEGFRSWNPNSGREDGGSPSDFDGTAATWLVRKGMPVSKLVDVFRHRIEAGTWMVRFFTPLRKEEIFVEVDPRTSRVVGYHKYQEEQNRGAALPQGEALAIAEGAFAKYGIDVRAFALKDALSFQQPNRRDWLFHFEEKTPLAPRAFRRVTVRVAGAEVTQFNKTVKVPESVYREASTQTVLNLILFALKIAGIVTLLGLIIAGLIVATRAHGLPWRRALRWTLILSIIPAANFVATLQSTLFGYSTSVAWETFRVSLIIGFVRDVGLQVGLLFLALAGLEAAVPYAFDVFSREGRARFGRSAVIAVVATLAIGVTADLSMRMIAHAIPAAASVEFVAPREVATPLPALLEGSQAIIAAIVVAAAVALYRTALQRRVGVITTAAIFCTLLDPSVTAAQAPVMLARAAVLAILAWVVARHLLDGNPLAWPLVIFTASIAQTAVVLLHNHRPDLLANGVALIVAAILLLVWCLRPSSLQPERLPDV